MRDTREKFFFEPILRTYNDDLEKRWRIEWYVPALGGKAKRCSNPIYISGKTIEERYKHAENKVRGLRFDLPKEKPTTFFDKVFEYKFDWKRKTIANYKIVVKSYLNWCNKKLPETITEKQLPEYLMWMRKHNHTVKNIAKYRDTIYTFYEYAKQLKLLKHNPVSKETKIRFEKQSLMFFTDEQIKQFKECEIDKQMWLAIQLLFYCFIRPGEQRHMKIEWINFENSFIEVPAEWSKNKKCQKVIIPKIFLEKIQYLKSYPNDYYVLSKALKPGLIQLSEKWLNNEHTKILNKLQIRGRYAFYSWKHTGAVKAVKSGINIKDLQLRLRHHSLDMVNEYLKNLGVLDSEDLLNKYPVL